MKRLLFYILSIFILFPLNGVAQKQGSRQEGKRFEVLRDSGSFNFPIHDLIKDENIRQKYFSNVLYIKSTDRNTLLIIQKSTPKPSVRICVDKGTLQPHQGYIASNGQIYICADTLYSNPINLSSFKVKDIAKEERSVKVTIYDNITNACLGEKTFTLSPVIVHKYTAEIRYTDVDGNSQVYTNKTPCWIPASTTSPAFFIVRDEYGKQMKEKITYELLSSDSMGQGVPFRYTTETIPTEMLEAINKSTQNPTGKCSTKWYVISHYGIIHVEVLEIRK